MYIIILALIIVFFLLTSTRERFSGSAGTLYSEIDCRGFATEIAPGQEFMLFDGSWHFWSCRAVRDSVIKVTANGLPQALYLYAVKVDNLPAALGGLSAHENYTAIINSGRSIMVQLISLEQARGEVDRARDNCLTNTKNEQMCREEFAQLI